MYKVNFNENNSKIEDNNNIMMFVINWYK